MRSSSEKRRQTPRRQLLNFFTPLRCEQLEQRVLLTLSPHVLTDVEAAFSPAIVYYGSATFDPTATLIIEIGGTTPGSGHDQVVFTGMAGLNGTLKVELHNTFVPAIGDSFTILTAAGGITGSFTATAFPPLPAGRRWNYVATPNEIRLSVVSTVLINPWHNGRDPLDVDDDTFISPIDAVLVINYLNFNDTPILPVPDDAPVAPPFIDVDDDFFISPIDAVLVINWLNTHPVQAAAAAAEGKSESLPPAGAAAYRSASQPADAASRLSDDLLALLAFDGSSTVRRRRVATQR